MMGINHPDVFIHTVNSYCTAILDKVTVLKSSFAPHPLITGYTRAVGRICHKVECVQTSSELEVQRLHLRKLKASLNGMV